MNRIGLALLALVTTLQSGCGRGGSAASPGSVSVTPTPTPSPAPAPAPTPTPIVAKPFPPINVTASQSFSVLGYSYSYDNSSSGFSGGVPIDPNEAIALGFNAATGSYEAQLPGFASGRLILNQSSSGRSYTPTNGLSSTELQQVFVNFAAGDGLQYSDFVSWTGHRSISPNQRDGFFAFGIRTLPAGIPVSGTRSFSINGGGQTTLHMKSGQLTYRFIEVTGTLSFDFDKQTLSGNLKVIDPDEFDGTAENFGTFSLSGDTFSREQGAFSGTLTVPGLPGPATFDGLFTGPGANEIILRFRFPLQSFGADTQVYAAAVGRQQQ